MSPHRCVLAAAAKLGFEYSAQPDFADVDTDTLIEPYRRRIEEQFRFRPSTMTVKLDLAEARRAIREYRTATDDPFGAAELMMTYVEAGTHYVVNLGESEERVYNSLDSVLRELVDLLMTIEGRGMYSAFRERLTRVGALAAQCGYGYGDSVHDELSRLETALSGSPKQSSRRDSGEGNEACGRRATNLGKVECPLCFIPFALHPWRMRNETPLYVTSFGVPGGVIWAQM